MPRKPDTSPQTVRVFDALLRDPTGWHYGYVLSKQTGLSPGSLYPILARLVDRELLETRWEPSEHSGRPPRHLYRLTAHGVSLARQRVSERAERRPAGRAVPTLRSAM